MSDWMPIETAPKDGTHILLGRFTGDKKAKMEGHVRVDWYRTDRDTHGFIGFGEFNRDNWPPTHWKPLQDVSDDYVGGPTTSGGLEKSRVSAALNAFIKGIEWFPDYEDRRIGEIQSRFNLVEAMERALEAYDRK